MQQASVLDGPELVRFPPLQNGLATSGIDAGRRQISQAFVVSAVIVVVDVAGDLGLEVAGQVDWAFAFSAAAYNLLRLPKLLAEEMAA